MTQCNSCGREASSSAGVKTYRVYDCVDQGFASGEKLILCWNCADNMRKAGYLTIFIEGPVFK